MVREQFRTPRPIFQYDLQDPDRIEADYAKTGIPSPAGMPYPIRQGSSVCVWDHPFWVRLYELVERRDRLRASNNIYELFVELADVEAELVPMLKIGKVYQDACLKMVREYLEGKRGKATFSAARERATVAGDLKRQGLDPTGAESRDRRSPDKKQTADDASKERRSRKAAAQQKIRGVV